jgi:16S rRNA processing protein RimM
MPDRVCLGAIAGAQGVRGAVRIKPFTARPQDVAAYGPVEDESGTRRFRLRVLEVKGGMVIATAEGIADRDAAEALRGTQLWVGRDKLPPAEEDEFYHADLIGLAAVDEAGNPLGHVAALHDFGAGEVIEIAREGATSLVLPFTREVVPVVDIAAGRVVVVLPAEA